MIRGMSVEPDTFEGAVSTALARWRLFIEPEQIEKLRAHFQAVVEANRTMNLTRITDPLEAAIMHYADSLALLPWIRDRDVTVHTVLDVGTGAGFPAVPLAVMRPDWSVTALDATGKKVAFLRQTVGMLGLANLHCEHAHSRHWKPGGTFDLVVSRALTKLPTSLQDTARQVTPDGWLIAYKTPSMDAAERDAATTMAHKLRLHVHEHYVYGLQLGDETLHRLLYVYRKPRQNA
jgi:16S rRNA (guanine527-N7)-methyltransferase